jgi:hypothetical protein
VRQTRIKLLDLARARAKDLAVGVTPDTADGGETGRRRPLHRQSSMDFMSTAKIGTRAADRFGRLASPRASLLNPHTPSSSTLASASTSGLGLGPPPRLSRRASAMTLSSVSTDSCCLVDPRVQRIRRSGSFGDGAPAAPGTPAAARRTLKRAPSASSSGSTKIDGADPSTPEPKTRPRKGSGASAASDEDEKARGKKAVRSPSPPPSAPPSSLPCSPEVAMSPPPLTAPVRRRRLAPARSPPVFGPELPHLAPRTPAPVSACPSAFPVLYSAAAAVNAASSAERESRRRSVASPEARRVVSPEARRSVASPESPSLGAGAHRLRRVKATTFAPVARRISFGSLRAEESAPAPAALAGVLEDAFCLEY